MITQLTEKEKKVLLYLVEYPELNDIELSSKTGIKRSTITAIRNRLRKENFYKTVAIPNFPRFGCKLLGVLYGRFNPETPREARESAQTFQEKIEHPELVFARSTDTEVVAIYLARNLADIRRVQDRFIIDYKSHNFLEEVNQVFYPLEMCDVSSFFNYSPLLSKLFGLPLEEVNKNFWTNFEPANLTKTEKIILLTFVKYPDKSNIEISKITGKTRSTVSKIRKELIDNGLVAIRNIPSLQKLDCELMLFFHTKFGPNASREKRKDGMELSRKEGKHIFKISGDIESVGIMVFKNYTEYKEIFNKLDGFYKEKKYIRENPQNLILPVNKIKLDKLDFAPLTEKMLFTK